MSILNLFSSPTMFSVALLLLSISNLFMIYAFGRMLKTIDVLRMCIISERNIGQMIIDKVSLEYATPTTKICQ